jgi:YfiH family protein
VRTTVKPGKKKRGRLRADPTRVEQTPEGKLQERELVKLLQAAKLNQFPWLAYGFSTRPGGVTTCYHDASLNLGFTKEDPRDCVLENRHRFLTALGAATEGRPWPLIAPRQVHSDIIYVVRKPDPGQLIGDALITNLPGIAIAIQTADCLPVLVLDAKKRVIGVFHAGWRGTVKRIVEKGVGTLRREFGSRAEDIHAAIGPGIRKCCYEVGEELRDEFATQFPYADDLFHEVHASDPIREKYPLLFLSGRPPGHGDAAAKLHLDLCEANHRQLLAAGVPARQITALAGCTACDTAMFFSHRAEKGRTGRMMVAAGILP